MNQILELSWWFSFFPQAVWWWVFCVLAAVAVLPLCLRVFGGLADRGASAAPAVGLILVAFLGWWLSMRWFGGGPEAMIWRLACLVVACGLLGIALFLHRRGALGRGAFFGALYPAVLLAVVGLVHIPRSPLLPWVALLAVAGASVAAWACNPVGLVRALRRAAVPFLASQVLFLVAFLFFVNVRSYIPFATFELMLYQAEKWGNLAHIGSVMSSTSMPPRDIWWDQEPVNYYYGGHLLTATIAKAVGTPAVVAFNLGLATLFALTMTTGFCFVLSLVHLTTRKVRLPGRFVWHSGMAWALFGALAITMFGNLDSWRQIFTRDVDWGVKFRHERVERQAQEEWKQRVGIPAAAGVRLYTAVSATPQRTDRLGALESAVDRVLQERDTAAADAEKIAKDYEKRVSDLQNAPRQPLRQIEEQLGAILLSAEAQQVYQRLTSVNAQDFQERLFRDLVGGGAYSELGQRVANAAKAHSLNEGPVRRLKFAIEEEKKAAITSPELTEFRRRLKELAQREPAYSIFNTTAVQADKRMDEYGAANDYANFARAMNVYTRALSGKTEQSTTDKHIGEALSDALARIAGDPTGLLDEVLGGQPPIVATNPTGADLRFTWSNMAFVDFWAPSRAIKGSPKDSREAGTITEFPYFSAILGDHHPHHFALPFNLCALCACLSLMRKNSRRKRDDLLLFKRSWPELLAMAFFIGAVFPVNIWDAVVLAPLYAVVIMTAMRHVYPSEGWRWVGFAGFIILMAMVVGLLHNSIPGVAPLFQNFKAFLLAVLVLVGAVPLVSLLLPRLRPLWVALVALVVAAGLVGAGALVEPGAGGPGAASAFSNGLRDVLVFALLAGIAASWTMGRTYAGHRWWYAVGGIYAFVGGASLFVFLPFKLYFESPLQPALVILYNAAPPILSWEMINYTGGFWETFWRGSPVNPFPAELRTDFRDFFVHWGIFVVPITFLAVFRFFRFSRETHNGFSFMAAMCVLSTMVFARNYLGYWAGAFSLGMAVLALFYAMHFVRRAEGPAWTFLAGAFAWCWFVEALHFDDDYAGYLERYNTPFKIYYPLWPMFAGAMVVAVREVLGRFRVKHRSATGVLASQEWWVWVLGMAVLVPVVMEFVLPRGVVRAWQLGAWLVVLLVLVAGVLAIGRGRSGRFDGWVAEQASRAMSRWPAFVAAMALLLIGMHYPIAATMTRTQNFFTWPIVDSYDYRQPHRNIFIERTLDATAHLAEFAKYREDHKAMEWVRANVPQDATVMERPGRDAYSHVGRMSSGSSRATVVAWQHHEHQWRGRGRPAPGHMKLRYMDDVAKPDFNAEFAAVLKTSVQLDEAKQNELRLMTPKQRMKALAELFPESTLMARYRLSRIVDQRDVSMMQVGDTLFKRAEEMYREKSRDVVARRMGEYGVDYLVIGQLERDEYGQDLLERFKNWGFEVVYNSADDVRPADATPIEQPTMVLKVPADFAATGAAK